MVWSTLGSWGFLGVDFYDLDFTPVVSYTDLFLCMKVHWRFGRKLVLLKLKLR